MPFYSGSSLMEQFPICEIAMSAGITKPIYNRGVSGYTTDDFLREIHTVLLDLHPSKVFLNIGTNDMSEAKYGKDWIDRLETQYDKILALAVKELPDIEFYCMAYYPANLHLHDQNAWAKKIFASRTPENIDECNRRIEKLAKKYGCHYINANAGLYDENHEQKACFAKDGVHMYDDAYEIVFANLRQYI